jgi:hypothetical protein
MNIVRSETNELGCNLVIQLFSIHVDVEEEFVANVGTNKGTAVKI